MRHGCTLHKGGHAPGALVDRAASEGAQLLRHIGSPYDADLDVEGVVHRFRELDRQYVNSKFPDDD